MTSPAHRTGIASPPTAACWCGNERLVAFNADYARCEACGTLVLTRALPEGHLVVRNDETDFYGKSYWLSEERESFGYGDIAKRARADLPERNLYWLRTFLKYRTPPGRVLELGCGPGSFLALLRFAGFGVRGVEMSPWVVDFGRQAFGVPVDVGPVESLEVERASLDAVVLMDVLEHLPNPVGTMRHCLDLLKPDGIFLIQTPKYDEGFDFEALRARDDPFLQQLREEEHLFLFSERSIVEFFARLGAECVAFEPAIFAHYDMFLAVGRRPLVTVVPDASVAALTSTPGGRLVQAMLDLAADVDSRAEDGSLSSADARSLYASRDQLQNEGNLLRAQLADALSNFEKVEADRVARGDVIETQGRRLSQLESSMDETLRKLEQSYETAEAIRNERNLLAAKLSDALENFSKLEDDRNARGEVIESQGRRLSEVEALMDETLRKLQAAYEAAEAVRNDRNLLSAQLADLRRNFDAVEADRVARGEVITSQGSRIDELQRLVDERLAKADAAQQVRTALEADLAASRLEAGEFRRRLEESEADRAARLSVIEQQGSELGQMRFDLFTRGQEIEALLRTANMVTGERDRAQTELMQTREHLSLQQSERQLIDELLARVSVASPAPAKGKSARSTSALQDSAADDSTTDGNLQPPLVPTSETAATRSDYGRSIDELTDEIRLLQLRRDELAQIEGKWLFRLGRLLHIL